jgi:hypothetical protein
MARNKSSHKQNVWNAAKERFELIFLNPTKAGRQKSKASLNRKKRPGKK